MCPRERLVLISISTVLSLLRKDWATYLFVLYYCYLLFVLLPCQKTTKNPFAKYSQGFPAPYHCSAPSAPRWDRHSYLSKVIRYTPYTCGSSRTLHGWVVTHKYRGCIVVLSINRSVDPNEEQKVFTSGLEHVVSVILHKRIFRGF